MDSDCIVLVFFFFLQTGDSKEIIHKWPCVVTYSRPPPTPTLVGDGRLLFMYCRSSYYGNNMSHHSV